MKRRPTPAVNYPLKIQGIELRRKIRRREARESRAGYCSGGGKELIWDQQKITISRSRGVSASALMRGKGRRWERKDGDREKKRVGSREACLEVELLGDNQHLGGQKMDTRSSLVRSV